MIKLLISKVVYLNPIDINRIFEFISNTFGSLSKFALWCGYTKSYVSAFLNGKKYFPPIIAERLYREFGFNIYRHSKEFCLC